VYVPGQGPVKSLTLCSLMDRLEQWEEEQASGA
jgi:hypothetical protein